jgi:hypothetical protein
MAPRWWPERWRGDAPCSDCRRGTAHSNWVRVRPWEWYGVHDEVWAAAGARPWDILCIGCLERRLGRQLNAADFTGVEINSLDPRCSGYAWWHRTPRLTDRLRKPPP